MQIMGILNLTPDSYFEGTRTTTLSDAQKIIENMWTEGADIIDIGAESTRPGAEPISVDEELNRLLPLLEWLQHQSIPFSIDTRTPEVMAAVMPYKPSMINDIEALQAPGALDIMRQNNVDICLMHKKGAPITMQENPTYIDIIQEVIDFFQERLNACLAVGISKDRILLDPGFGFGKTLQHNIKMLQCLPAFKVLGCRLLVGMSRKSMIGAMLNKPVNERLYGSLTAHTIAFMQGADMVRTHDVAATKDALKILLEIK